MTDGGERPCRVPASVKRTGAYWVLVPDEIVDVAVVNEMGHHVYLLCNGSRSAATIANEITEATGVDIEIVTKDVETYLAQLKHAGLVTIENK